MSIKQFRFNQLALILFMAIYPHFINADELDDFVDDVNSAWSSTNDSQVVTLINQRLSQNTNDIAALSVKMYYHLWIDGNITNSQLIATQLNSLVQASTNQAVVDIFSFMKIEVDGISLTESGALSQDALNQFRHETRGIFPNINKCIWLARTMTVPD